MNPNDPASPLGIVIGIALVAVVMVALWLAGESLIDRHNAIHREDDQP